jgi:hypothetical protein
MGAPAGGAGGNTGADAGFFISEEEKKRKANESLIGTPDYQGNLNPPKKTKTKTTNQQNLEDAERMQRENRGGNQPTVKVTETPKVDTSPTQVEVDQSSATDADADDIYTRKKKSKARGRSIMTLTSSQGITDEKLTLGKPSLLGS